VLKRSPFLIAIIGVGLLALGAALTYMSSRRYSEQHVVANAGSCRLEMNVVQLAGLPENSQSGNVILFHGLAANKVIMNFLARAFAQQGLRVFVPDLPGHGRSAGPFSPDNAESCALSFVRGLTARGYLRPDRTILVGHSMGGAIALRVAAKLRVAGVVAISPAPMKTDHGVTPEALLYLNPPPVPPNSLIIVGQLEPEGLRDNAADLAASSTDPTTKFVILPYNSHLSILFSPAAARMAQQWIAQILHLQPAPNLPFRGDLLGGFLGLAGILLIAGPFLRESIGEQPLDEIAAAKPLPTWRLVLEVAAVSLAVIALLHYWIPLKVLHLFEGDYLASFFLLAGLLLFSLHGKRAQRAFPTKWTLLLGAAFSALVLCLLITGWLQLTITGSWLTIDRWKRFPLYFVAAWVFLYAFEVLLGKVQEGARRKHLLLSLGLLCLVWLALTFGVIALHSGAILLVLLAPYFLVLFVLMRLGAQLVRMQSGSPLAASVFSAILITGFCLVIFPVT
jgi:pimeloyl-ACP methyl ester carboxylesterase